MEETITKYENEMEQRTVQMIEHMTAQDIYVTGMGDCWHADYLCARQRAQLVVYTRRPCRVCVRRYGNPANAPPAGQDDYRDIDGS